ncbi:MAG: WbqC family protein [Alphaproteobacteria bacterium]|nr:WbqC family protein [Alphaproteobacteria bacterium]
MRVAVMQPYLWPYLGYFNLIHAVDVFVFLDDVQYIRRGWINRNRIQQGGVDLTFTLPVEKAPRETPVDEVRIAPDRYAIFVEKFTRQLSAVYGGAPEYDAVAALVAGTLECDQASIGAMAEHSVREVCAHIGLERDMRRASQLPDDVAGRDLRGGDRLAHIARGLGATEYVNPPGGRSLYTPELFASYGLGLGFVAPELPVYTRPAPFISGLSILDALMYCPPTVVMGLVGRYSVQS